MPTRVRERDKKKRAARLSDLKGSKDLGEYEFSRDHDRKREELAEEGVGRQPRDEKFDG